MAYPKTPPLTQVLLKSLLHYEASTGVFTWLVGKRGAAHAGKVAGCPLRRTQPNTYHVIRVGGRLYAAHRLAWFYVYGWWPQYIDHKNTLKADNRLDNLRASTKAQNGHNVGLRTTNTSGFKGVHRASRAKRRTKPWVAEICTQGERRCIGYFETPEKAAAAYQAAALKEHGEFARTT